jgi:transcription initiation factor TFIIIB Brf1 subunit/transcription initiation factor TFIIB
MRKEYNKEICPRCGAENSKVEDRINGEIVCNNCGKVYEERTVDETYEKRNFGSDSNGNKGESRVGGPIKASEGNNLGNNLIIFDKNGLPQKIKSTGTHHQTQLERNFEEIDKILGNKEISTSLREETKEIYQEVTKQSLKMKGRNFKHMVCAMYFIACRKKNTPKSFKDISKIFGYEEKRIKKAYNYIKSVVVKSVSPEEMNETIFSYIRSFCEVNNENFDFRQLAKTIAKNINESCLLEGRNTRTITGISILIASKLIQPQHIDKASIIQEYATENTLDTVFQKIRGDLNKIIPEKYHSKIQNFSIK